MELSLDKPASTSVKVAGRVQAVELCPLCRISQGEVIVEFERWKLARTKTMKGHKERLMLYHKDHVKTLDEGSIGEAYLLLMKAGSKFFSYTDKWAIFEPVYATVPDHWHRIASDLDKNAEDHAQILKTPRMIIDNHEGTLSRAYPDNESTETLAKSN
ncbi:MAG: hypothetical protein AUF79_11535 [Crenarchaeota archaeon 13_1_20CM_2_51_8]|nr:MAG: hypothetical protein AUF79_11535 [Crenarchaeota archaeon 13_1_20CM_2_51_8]